MLFGDVALASNVFSVRENESGGKARITITRSGDLSLEATLTLGVVEGTATRGADFLFPGDFQTVTIAAGAASVVVEIPIVNDSLAEDTESFFVDIVAVENARLLAPRTAEVRILDDERVVAEPPTPPLVSSFVVQEQIVRSGVTAPIAFEFSPVNPSHVYVATKPGLVEIYDVGTGARVAQTLDIRAQVNDIQDRGLMDIAFHPDLRANPYLYAFYVVDPADAAGLTGAAGADGGGNRFAYVSRFTLDSASGYQRVVPGSETVILGGAARSRDDISGRGALDFTSPAYRDSGLYVASDIANNANPADPVFKKDYVKVDSRTHAGGALAFGPDGKLYVSIGDGTSYNYADPRTVYVQDPDSLSGKVLRIDPITGLGLPDNPFAAGPDLSDNRDKVWQMGFRNPFSMGFDPSGRLFVTDTGWNAWEEINTGGAAANFGWPYYEGGDGALIRTPGYRDFASATAFYADVAAGRVTVSAPFRGFGHAESAPGFQVQAITGGDAFITGNRYPAALANHYVFADVSQGEVFSIDAYDRTDVQFLYKTTRALAPVHFGRGPDGFVYFADLIGGAFGRLLITDPSGGGRPDDVVFGSSTYRLGTAGLSWAEAQAEAQRLGGRLVEIDSRAENDFVVRTFGGSAPIWLGLSDAAVEGTWRKGSGGAPTFVNWLPGEPNNRGEQDYAVIASADGRWDDQTAAGGWFRAANGVWRGGLQTISVIEIPNASPPPPPPPPSDTFVFGSSTYRRGTAGLSWAEAQAEAQRLGGRLVEIDSRAENDFVVRTFGGSAPIWLGLTDAAVEGTWRKGSGGAPTFVNWLPGEPNNRGEQDYAVIASADGRWDDQTAAGGWFRAANGVWRGGFATLSVIEFDVVG